MQRGRFSLTLALLGAAAGCGQGGTTTGDAGLAHDGATDAGMVNVVDEDHPPVPFEPPSPTLRRLTQSQYTHTLRDVLGDDIVVPRALEPDVPRAGLAAIGASETSVSRRGVEQFQAAAFAVAEQVLRDPARRARLVTCTPMGVRDDRCAGEALGALGRRLWRRPLAAEELAGITTVAGRAAEALGDFWRGLEYGLAAVLQAPDMVFRVEVGVADPARPGFARYTPYELAGRMAWLLWDGPPDAALLDAAGGGALDTPDGLRTEATRMLADPKARRGLRAFLSDWLHLGELDRVSRDAMLFPGYGPDLAAAAREETLRTATWIAFDEDRDFRDLLTSRDTFVNRRLASVYRVQFPQRAMEGEGDVFARVTFAESDLRRGLLGQASTLLLHAHPTSTSPTLRGKFIREALLCSPIPMPPVELNTAVPEPSETLRTLRERLAAHNTVPRCASCHRLTDPLGLTLESFDAIGRSRRIENGVPIDTSGELDGRRFADARALAQTLHDDPAVSRCLVQTAYRFAQGREDADGELGEIRRLHGRFRAEGYRWRALMLELVTGEAFRVTRVIPMAQGGAP